MALIREVVKAQEETIFHTPYGDIAEAFFQLLAALDVSWAGSSDIISDTKWKTHGKEMCYFLETNRTVSYSAKSYFKSEDNFSHMPIHTLGQKD